MDNARKQTDKILNRLERRIDEVYRTDPSLLRVQKKYERYMAEVEKQVSAEYKAYRAETEIEKKREAKKIYKDKVWTLTYGSRVYQDIVRSYTEVMASVNQKALDMVNAEMAGIYAINYNQMANVCRVIGISINE